MIVRDDRMFDYVCKKTGCELPRELSEAFYVVSDDDITGAIVFTYIGCICYLSIYTKNPKWCSRKVINEIFNYPFKNGDVKIVKATTSAKNKEANKFLSRLKLREEGYLRYNRPDGSHERVFSATMQDLKKKRWFKWVE